VDGGVTRSRPAPLVGGVTRAPHPPPLTSGVPWPVPTGVVAPGLRHGGGGGPALLGDVHGGSRLPPLGIGSEFRRAPIALTQENEAVSTAVGGPRGVSRRNQRASPGSRAAKPLRCGRPASSLGDGKQATPPPLIYSTAWRTGLKKPATRRVHTAPNRPNFETMVDDAFEFERAFFLHKKEKSNVLARLKPTWRGGGPHEHTWTRVTCSSSGHA
jgi:hypothetical protein